LSRLLLHLILTVIVFLLGAANVRANEQLLIVQSEAGDPLLKGLQATITSFSFGRGNSGHYFTGSVGEGWTGDWVNVTFRAPANGPLHPGVYDNTIDRSSSIEEDALPGLSVSLVFEGSGTFPARGRFEVLKVTYSGSGDVVVFHATFSLKVDGASGGLTGEIRLNTDSTTPTMNQAPGISAGGVLRVLPNIPVELPGIASDDNLPAGSALSYQWTGPTGVTFDNANVLRPIARFQDVGTYQLYLWAFDGSLYGYTDLEVHVLPPGIETVLRIRSVPCERCFGGAILQQPGSMARYRVI
jgi:hypothetical protein